MPVYSFGENELFQQVILSEGSLGRRLQDLFKSIMGFAPCLFVGERFALLPFRKPVTTVGKYTRPLPPNHPLNPLILIALSFQLGVLSRCPNV